MRYKFITAALLAALGLSAASGVSAQMTVSKVQIPVSDSVHDVTSISGWLYAPTGGGIISFRPGMVLMHGCGGIWPNQVVHEPSPGQAPDLQNHIDKWATKLANSGYVTLVVDSFTSRYPTQVFYPAPPFYTTSEWQDQCSGSSNVYENDIVDEFTTRSNDALAGLEYLAGLSTVDRYRVGVLGWSAGAEASMVQTAATPRTSNEPRFLLQYKFEAGVLFYPGCGAALGFGVNGSPSNPSFWRPYTDIRMNHGTGDPLYNNCPGRVSTAQTTYGAVAGSGREALLESYTDATHTFDLGSSAAWPASKCNPVQATNDCAMRDADIDSLEFLDARLK